MFRENLRPRARFMLHNQSFDRAEITAVFPNHDALHNT
jgi:hypothetical protein